MKKFFLFVSALAALCMSTSCQKEALPKAPQPGNSEEVNTPNTRFTKIDTVGQWWRPWDALVDFYVPINGETDISVEFTVNGQLFDIENFAFDREKPYSITLQKGQKYHSIHFLNLSQFEQLKPIVFRFKCADYDVTITQQGVPAENFKENNITLSSEAQTITLNCAGHYYIPMHELPPRLVEVGNEANCNSIENSNNTILYSGKWSRVLSHYCPSPAVRPDNRISISVSENTSTEDRQLKVYNAWSYCGYINITQKGKE